jgi:hypothetical protein
LKTIIQRNSLNLLSMTAALWLVWSAQHAHGALVINIGSAAVDISSGVGTASASIDVFLMNNSGAAEGAFGYTLLYDFAPASPLSLSTGITFNAPAATSGGLFPSTIGFTVNTASPAFGDITLAEAQFSAVTFPNGFSGIVHTLHFDIDLATAVPGDYVITLDQSAASDGITNMLIPTTTYDPIYTSGTLSLTTAAVPEPGAWAFMLLLTSCVVGIRLWRKWSH